MEIPNSWINADGLYKNLRCVPKSNYTYRIFLWYQSIVLQGAPYGIYGYGGLPRKIYFISLFLVKDIFSLIFMLMCNHSALLSIVMTFISLSKFRANFFIGFFPLNHIYSQQCFIIPFWPFFCPYLSFPLYGQIFIKVLAQNLGNFKMNVLTIL